MHRRVTEPGEEQDEKIPQGIDELCKEIAEVYEDVELIDIQVPQELLNRLFPNKDT